MGNAFNLNRSARASLSTLSFLVLDSASVLSSVGGLRLRGILGLLVYVEWHDVGGGPHGHLLNLIGFEEVWYFQVFHRSAVGMAKLPFNIPVEIEAEVELYD